MYLTRSGYLACDQLTLPRIILLYSRSALFACNHQTLLLISLPCSGSASFVQPTSCKESLPNYLAALWENRTDQSLFKDLNVYIELQPSSIFPIDTIKAEPGPTLNLREMPWSVKIPITVWFVGYIVIWSYILCIQATFLRLEECLGLRGQLLHILILRHELHYWCPLVKHLVADVMYSMWSYRMVYFF